MFVPRMLKMTPGCCSELSWQAATERLLAAASIGRGEWPGAAGQVLDDVLWSPYRLFALLFTAARTTFAPAPRLIGGV
jgi:hypothetical protein